MTTLPYPEGLTTRQIIIKGASSLEGGQALVRKALFEASSSLVWLPTGWVFEQVDRLVVSPLGSDFVVPIPVTDLNLKWGVADRPGSVIDTSAPNAHSHSYRVTVSTWDETETVRLAIRVYDDVFIPTGDLSALTLESMIPVEAIDGRVVLIPDMLSEQVADALADAVELVAAMTNDYERLPSGPLTIPLGDSIDLGSDIGSHYSAGSIYNELTIQSGQRVQWFYNAGVGGNTTAAALARIDADVISRSPGVCIIGGGVTNDHAAGIAPAATRANLAAMVTQLRAAGIRPVLRLCPPVDEAGAGAFNTVALRRAGVQQHNAWARTWGPANGMDVLDYYSPLVDETTGGYLAALTTDGLHPTTAACKLVADAVIANGLPACFNGVPTLASAIGDASDILGGIGLFLGAPSGGVATGWSHYGNDATLAVEADADIPGNWQTITGGTSEQHILYDYLITTGFAVGDVLQFSARVQKTDEASTHIRLRLSSLPGEWDAWDIGEVNVAGGVRALDGIVAGRMTVPAGTVRLGVELVAFAPATVKVAQVTLTNLTALGIA